MDQPRKTGGYSPEAPPSPPVPPQGGTAVVPSPLAAATDEASSSDEQSSDEELAADAALEQLAARGLLDTEDLVGRQVAGKPSTIHLEDAMAQWDLEPAEVLGWQEKPEEELVVVTAGGKKLRWPDDMEVTLTDAQRGRTVPSANRVFPVGYLRRDASKDPTD